MGWKMFHRTLAYPLFLLLPVMWMFAAFCLQRVLPARAARIFNLLHAGFLVILTLLTALGFAALRQTPSPPPMA